MVHDSDHDKLVRLEERMVTLVGEIRLLRTDIKGLTENHWRLSGKVVGIASSVSLLVTVLTLLLQHHM